MSQSRTLHIIAFALALLATLSPARSHAQANEPPPIGDPSEAFHAINKVAREAFVQSTLNRMQTAILAGDPDAYLANIDPEDPIFFKEQQNFAADLKTNKPHECTIDLLEEEDETEEVKEARPEPSTTTRAFTTTIRMKWAWAKEGEPNRFARSIDLPVRFVERDGRWLYAGERWHELSGLGEAVDRRAAGIEESDQLDANMPRLGRVLVQYEPDLAEVAREVIQAFPEVARHVLIGFGRIDAPQSRDRVQRIKLYSSMKHLQHSIYLSYRDGLGGWNEPGESIKLLVQPFDTRRDLKNVLAHELGHQLTFDLGEHANQMPWWVLEGVAELSAARFAGGFDRADAMARSWAKRGGLKDWESLRDFRGEAAKHQTHVYVQGQHMLQYVTTRYGREGRNQWLTAMAQGQSLDEATLTTLQMPFADLDLAWRATLPPQDADQDGAPSETR